jgi:hypothetical protein
MSYNSRQACMQMHMQVLETSRKQADLLVYVIKKCVTTTSQFGLFEILAGFRIRLALFLEAGSGLASE